MFKKPERVSNSLVNNSQENLFLKQSLTKKKKSLAFN